jgi:hypothetical protein
MTTEFKAGTLGNDSQKECMELFAPEKCFLRRTMGFVVVIVAQPFVARHLELVRNIILLIDHKIGPSKP